MMRPSFFLCIFIVFAVFTDYCSACTSNSNCIIPMPYCDNGVCQLINCQNPTPIYSGGSCIACSSSNTCFSGSCQSGSCLQSESTSSSGVSSSTINLVLEIVLPIVGVAITALLFIRFKLWRFLRRGKRIAVAPSPQMVKADIPIAVMVVSNPITAVSIPKVSMLKFQTGQVSERADFIQV